MRIINIHQNLQVKMAAVMCPWFLTLYNSFSFTTNSPMSSLSSFSHFPAKLLFPALFFSYFPLSSLFLYPSLCPLSLLIESDCNSLFTGRDDVRQIFIVNLFLDYHSYAISFIPPHHPTDLFLIIYGASFNSYPPPTLSDCLSFHNVIYYCPPSTVNRFMISVFLPLSLKSSIQFFSHIFVM